MKCEEEISVAAKTGVKQSVLKWRESENMSKTKYIN